MGTILLRSLNYILKSRCIDTWLELWHILVRKSESSPNKKSIPYIEYHH